MRPHSGDAAAAVPSPQSGPYDDPDTSAVADEVTALRAQLNDALSEMQEATDQLREQSASFLMEAPGSSSAGHSSRQVS